MKKIFALFIAILTFVGASAQNYSVAQVRQRINSMTAHINTMSCNFVQTKKLHMLKSSVSSRGKMYYSKPNRLRWEYTSPYRYQFVMNGQTVTMRNARGTSRADVAQSKVFKEITRIMMSSVVGSCVNDSRDFKVALQGRWKQLACGADTTAESSPADVQLYHRLLRYEAVDSHSRQDD